MIDSANSVLQGIVNQFELAYEEPDGTIIATDNPDIEEAYKTVVERRCRTRSTRGSGGEDWNASMATASSQRCSAPAGCSASSRAPLLTSRAGTSPMSSRPAAETGAVRT